MDLRVDRDADLPLGAQLAGALRDRIASGALSPGDRLPSVRELAAEAGVNVNTARAVYRRLENEGTVRSEHGRGTFVAQRVSEASARRELRRQIAELESELARRGPRAAAAGTGWDPPSRTGARLATTDELAQIRDDLVTRLQQLDVARADVLRRLAELDAVEAEAPEPERDQRSSASLRGARVRWVGA
jgi:GntR family transcriptional regulator